MKHLLKHIWWLATTPKAARCPSKELCEIGVQCEDKRQCFDPCGDLGHDPEFMRICEAAQPLGRMICEPYDAGG